jgi:hypothetical protein
MAELPGTRYVRDAENIRMKTLLYLLAGNGHGTSTLYHAFTAIGVEAGHEIIGMGSAGSVNDRPQHIMANANDYFEYKKIHMQKYSDSDGDGQLGDLYASIRDILVEPLRWQNEITDAHINILRQATVRFLEGEGVFADMNGMICHFFPLFDRMEIPTRSIHITSDPRQLVRKMLADGQYLSGLKGYNYGKTHNWEHKIPILNSKYKSCSRLEQICHAWTDMHNMFAHSGRRQIRVEEFSANASQAAQVILGELYPQASQENIALFAKNIVRNDRIPTQGYSPDKVRENMLERGAKFFYEWSPKEKDTLYDICGPLMSRFGYRKDDPYFQSLESI